MNAVVRFHSAGWLQTLASTLFSLRDFVLAPRLCSRSATLFSLRDFVLAPRLFRLYRFCEPREQGIESASQKTEDNE